MKNFTQKATLISLVLILFSFNETVKAQTVTALVSNGVTTIFGEPTQFADAYNAASDGDTIYLPGGPIVPVTINKGIAIYGAGYHPDSTAATTKTYLTSNLYFSENADSASITGVEVNGSIYTGSGTKVDYLVISRCNIKGINFSGTGSTPSEHITVQECIIRGGINLQYVTYSNISNNIVETTLSNGSNNAIYNNIFLYNRANSGYTVYYLFNSVNSSHIANNVVFEEQAFGNCNTNTISNNIFRNTPSGGTNIFENNYYDVDLTTVFVNQTGNTFDFAHNYNIADTVTYRGFDDTVVGIYGGLHPFKDGGLPNNPHIQSKDLATQTDSNGNLHIEIKVASQDY